MTLVSWAHTDDILHIRPLDEDDDEVTFKKSQYHYSDDIQWDIIA